jgi:hypothetical protein
VRVLRDEKRCGKAGDANVLSILAENLIPPLRFLIQQVSA